VKQLVIVGSSAAGLSALEAIRRVDPGCRITVVSAEQRPAYSRVMLPHLVSGEEESAEIRAPDYFRELSVSTAFGRKAVSFERGELLMEDGGRIPYDGLLLATGASPRLPPVEGIAAEGVCTLRTLADAEAIGRRLDGTKSVLIIGAGRICVLAARAFLARGLRVEVVESEATVLSGMLDRPASERARARLEGLGIGIRTGTEVARVVAGRAGVEAAITSTGEDIRAELVLVGAGNRPDLDLAVTGGIAVSKGVLVDRRMRTSVEGVYAAGDVAESPDLLFPDRRVVCGTWTEAVRQGWIAGLNMAGREGVYEGSLRMNALDVMGLPAVSMGVTEPPDAGNRVISTSSGHVYRKLVMRDDRLVGAVLVGDVEDAGVLAGLIRTGTPLDAAGGNRLVHRARYGDVLRASLPAR
jgi:NAD(P)H-nitrite reductase large subunit